MLDGSEGIDWQGSVDEQTASTDQPQPDTEGAVILVLPNGQLQTVEERDGALFIEKIIAGLNSLRLTSGRATFAYAALPLPASPSLPESHKPAHKPVDANYPAIDILYFESCPMTISRHHVSITATGFSSSAEPQNQTSLPEPANESAATESEIHELVVENWEHSFTYLIAIHPNEYPFDELLHFHQVHPSNESEPAGNLKFSFTQDLVGKQVLIVIRSKDELTDLDQCLTTSRPQLVDNLIWLSEMAASSYPDSRFSTNGDPRLWVKKEATQCLEFLEYYYGVTELKMDILVFPVDPKPEDDRLPRS